MWSDDEKAIGEATAVEQAFESYQDMHDPIPIIDLDLGDVTVQMWSDPMTFS